eukprot:4153013-Pleurochrysis_carterae.AAC.3
MRRAHSAPEPCTARRVRPIDRSRRLRLADAPRSVQRQRHGGTVLCRRRLARRRSRRRLEQRER